MKINDLSLPTDPDKRMIVAAMLTAAVCSLRVSPDKAEPYVCAMYQRFLQAAEDTSSTDAMKDWETLGDDIS